MAGFSMGRIARGVAATLGLLVVVWVLALAVWARVGAAPPLGLVEGRLRPCPATPNCVATEGATADQTMTALPTRGDASATIDRLARLIETQPRTVVVERRGDYLHAEFRSRLFRYVDDVEFHVAEGTGVVHFRSASRIGRGDMGVNRARLQALSAAYLQP